MADSRFDEQQIAAILKRASEIQSGLAPETDSPGITQSELQKVAAEVGIQPHALDQAIRELESSKIRPYEKGSSRTLDCTVEGIVTDDQWEDIVTRIREFVGHPGKSEVRGNSREWGGGWDLGHISLTATSRGSQTRFRMWIDTTGASILGWIVGGTIGFFGTILASTTLGKQGFAPILTALVATLCVLAASFGTFFTLRGIHRKLNRKAQDLFAAIVSQATPQPETPPQPILEPEVQKITLEQK